jgi:predicted RNA-binding protein with PIN domain
VVLDGPAPPRDLAEQLGDARIGTIYGGAQQTADERIARYLAEDSAARRICVVSSDREVQRAAASQGASFVKSEVFFETLHRDLSRGAAGSGDAEPEEKGRGVSSDGVNAWLSEFGFDPDAPAPFEHP